MLLAAPLNSVVFVVYYRVSITSFNTTITQSLLSLDILDVFGVKRQCKLKPELTSFVRWCYSSESYATSVKADWKSVSTPSRLVPDCVLSFSSLEY